MRVLRLSAGLDSRIGGPVESTVISTIATVDRGVEVEIAVVSDGVSDAAAVARLTAAGVTVHRFPVRGRTAGRRISLSTALLPWLWANVRRFDVVHAHGAWTVPSVAALLAARGARIPFVLTPHESLTEHDVNCSSVAGRAMKRVVRRIYERSAAAIVFASELEQEDSRVRARDRVISHPVEIAAAPTGVRPDGAPFRIGFLGRFDRKKNLGLLFAALPPRAELVVAGDGTAAEREAARQAAALAGVADRVTWLGFVEGDAKRRFFERVDVLAMPSRYECFGMVAAEALAVGVPVVVGSRTGIAPLVVRHDCGFVVEPQRLALRSALEAKVALYEKATRARRAAVEELAPASHARGLLELYGELIGARCR